MRLLLFALAFVPQDPAPPDPSALHKELLARFLAIKSVSSKLQFEAIDAAGVATLRYSTAIHYRPAEGWMYFEMNEAGKTSKSRTLVENFHWSVWTGGELGTRSDMTAAFDDLCRHQWRLKEELARAKGETLAADTFEKFKADQRPFFIISLDPSKEGDPEPATTRIITGRFRDGGASWVTLLKDAVKVTATDDEVTIRELEPVRTTVIDRRTGWIRSIRLDLPSGIARRMTVSDVVFDSPKPDIPSPKEWTRRTAATGEVAGWILREHWRGAMESLGSLAKTWDRVEADAVRDYFAWVAAEAKSLDREAAHAYWAASYVKHLVQSGMAVDELDEDLESKVEQFGEYLEAGDKSHRDSFTERLGEVRKELEKAAGKVPSTDEIRKALVSRIQEGFQPERVRKAKPSRAMPDPEKLLLEAIEAARREERKQ